MLFCQQKNLLRKGDIWREFGVSSKRLTMLKTKLIKKNATLAKLAKEYRFKQVKPACIQGIKLRSRKCQLRLDKVKGAYLKEALDRKPNLTLAELRTMIKRQFSMRKLSVSTVRNYMKNQLGYSCKVLQHSPANAFTDENKARRLECAQKILELINEDKKLLFCDEYCFSNQRMCRYGWA